MRHGSQAQPVLDGGRRTRSIRTMPTAPVLRDEPASGHGAADALIAAFAPMPFSDGAEVAVVHALRAARAITLALVAEETGTVLGQVIFSPAFLAGRPSEWHVVEGERALKIAAAPEVYPTYDEERRLEFAKRFSEFFFAAVNQGRVHTGYVEILWPRIDEFIAVYDQTKTTNHFAAGEAMVEALRGAQVAPPKFPPVVEPSAEFGKSRRGDGSKSGRDLDDDIPF